MFELSDVVDCILPFSLFDSKLFYFYCHLFAVSNSLLPSILEFGNDGLIVFDSFKVVIDDGNIGWFKFDDSVGQLIV